MNNTRLAIALDILEQVKAEDAVGYVINCLKPAALQAPRDMELTNAIGSYTIGDVLTLAYGIAVEIEEKGFVTA